MITYPNERPLKTLHNIGSRLAAKLRDVGIHTESDLRRAGSAQAYRRLTRRHPSVSSSLLTILSSLEGALLNRPWKHVPRERLRELLRALAA